MGLTCAVGTTVLSGLYLVPLAAGVAALPSPGAPIGAPWFPMMELLIMVTTPFMVGLMIAVHAWASPDTKIFATVAVVFMAMMTALTCSNHFVILAVARRPEFTAVPWGRVFVSFDWLSVTYALDILAWDGFFAVAVLSVALVFRGQGLIRAIRTVLLVSGILALVGIAGVPLDLVPLRNVGIAGYAVVFPVAAVLLVLQFKRTVPDDAERGVAVERVSGGSRSGR